MIRKECKWKEIKWNEGNEENDIMKRDEMEGVEGTWKQMIGNQRKWLTNTRRSMEMEQNDGEWENESQWKEGNERKWGDMNGNER